MALTKTFWYPIIKQIGKAIGIRVTKSAVANGVSKIVPVVGGVISGGLTFASMMPMAKRLQKVLDKANFDYTEEEFEQDIAELEQIQIDAENVEGNAENDNQTAKERVTAGIKNVGDGISSFIGKLAPKKKQAEEEPAPDNNEDIAELEQVQVDEENVEGDAEKDIQTAKEKMTAGIKNVGDGISSFIGKLAPKKKQAEEKSANYNNDVFDAIERLAKLRDSGAITQEEYDTKKQELLAKI